MNRYIVLAIFAGGLAALYPVGAEAQQSGFSVMSAAVSGPVETGFSSGAQGSGRIDPAYAASAGSPSNPTSFPFVWQNLPSGTKALALILDDPDAKLILAAHGVTADSFLHWTAADIDPTLGGLPADASKNGAAFVQGTNGAGKIGYLGPQPPADFPKDAARPIIHVYRLRLIALSAPTGLANGYSLSDLRIAIQGKVLGEAKLLFSYSNS